MANVKQRASTPVGRILIDAFRAEAEQYRQEGKPNRARRLNAAAARMEFLQRTFKGPTQC